MALRTENGWYQVGDNQLDRSPVPGTPLRLPLQRGWPSTIMKAFAADLNQYIESLNNSRGYTDEGGWTPTNSVATSNHLSGTAMDLNWNDHPFRIKDAGWNGSTIIPGNQVPAVRELLAWYEGMIFWGNDWENPRDAMHFQMGYGTYQNQKCADFIRRKIRPDGFSTYRRGGQGTPTAEPGKVITLAEVKQEQWDWMVKAVSELHAAMFNPIPSWSKYAPEGQGAVFQLHQLIRYSNADTHEWDVERSAMAGNPTAIALVKREADGGDSDAKYFYDTYCKEYTERQV